MPHYRKLMNSVAVLKTLVLNLAILLPKKKSFLDYRIDIVNEADDSLLRKSLGISVAELLWLPNHFA